MEQAVEGLIAGALNYKWYIVWSTAYFDLTEKFEILTGVWKINGTWENSQKWDFEKQKILNFNDI